LDGDSGIDFSRGGAPDAGADLSANRPELATPVKAVLHQAVKVPAIAKTIDVTLIGESFLLGNQMAESATEQIVCVAKQSRIYHGDIEGGLAAIGMAQRTPNLVVKVY